MNKLRKNSSAKIKESGLKKILAFSFISQK
jgi:hypothetical protein